ncbi:hypothetical protein AALP_AA1G169300 [Arabis alpina]|uniref:Carboxypeptidase n=1 Tax=Arabis alpina TaxID=50452 RepID=A0A087HNQ9_ARAAL|nr:hypothetical protein AALP_AA1G169300 [Arabis alpina]
MIGNFYELGPWRVVTHPRELERNPGAWNRIFGLLFIDNPIGVGYSIAASKQDIPRNQRQVAQHLYAALVEFIEQNPGFENRPVYITGESYAGKYVPAIGYYILNEKPNGKVNLKGLAIGNGLTDPVTQVQTHAVNVYYSGLVNAKQRVEVEKAQERSVALVKSKKWREAANARKEVLTLLGKMTGLTTLYNTARKVPYRTDLVVDLLNQRETKLVLGVNETMRFEECSDLVDDLFREDVMKSAKFTKVWKDGDGVLAGYVQRWGNLSHVAVSGAGHFVPTDKAVNSRDMIEDWVLGKGLFRGDDVKERVSSRLIESS